MSKFVRPYEAVIIMNPDCTEETQKQLFRRNKEIIEAHSGSVNHVDTWGKRVLANPIGKSKKGFYFHATFTADNKAVAELERTMRINENVLRFVHMRLDEKIPLAKHVEKFKEALAEGAAKEREREAKFQARRAAKMAAAAEGRDSRGE